MIVLLLDPSLLATGWVIFNTKTKEIIGYGCIQPSTSELKLEAVTKVTKLARELHKIIVEFQPVLIVSEAPFGAKSYSASRALFLCQGVIVGLSTETGIPVKFVLPDDIKEFLTGYKKGSKEQIQEACLKRLPKFVLPNKISKKERHAVYDALGVGLYWFRGEF